MFNLCLASFNTILFFTILSVVAVIVQILALVYGISVCRYANKSLLRPLLDISVLVLLLVQIYFLAEIMFNLLNGYFIVKEYATIRYLIFFVITILSILIIYKQKEIFPLAFIINASLTMPLVEYILKTSFVFAMGISIIFWIFIAINSIFNYHKREQNELSALSIKEALDNLDFGLLFYQSDGVNDGEIILINKKMQELMYTLVGKRIYNGKLFYENLKSNNILLGSVKQPIENQIVYKLPDNHVWNFNLERIIIRNKACALLVASDKTEIQNANLELYHQQRELEKHNEELHDMLNNLEELCRSEEVLTAKSRVHDLLGQRISLILRSVREHEKPDEVLLDSVANGLLEELKESNIERNYSLGKLAKNFKNLGIDISIEGQLPNNDKIRVVFYKIISEAMTNSIRHGFANEISIIIENDKDVWALLITDNGKVRNQKIVEGGGLKNMRKQVEELGGIFQYETKPNFTILVKISERGYL